MNSGTRTIGRSIEYLKRVAAVIRLREFDTSTPEGRSKERYRRILLSTASNLLTRGLQMLVGLVTIPLALSYPAAVRSGKWSGHAG